MDVFRILTVSKKTLDQLKSWDGLENIWLLTGSITDDKIIIKNLIPAATERQFQSVKLCFVQCPDNEKFLGTIHTHPPGNPNPSENDLRMDQKFVESLPQGFGIFGILCDKLRCFKLIVNDKHYIPITLLEI